MRKSLFALAVLLVVFVVIPVNVHGQAMPKKVVYAQGTEKAILYQDYGMEPIGYEKATNFMIGPGWADGFDIFIGAAYPISDRLYILGLANQGEIQDNKEFDANVRMFWMMNPPGKFNVGLLAGLGGLYEEIPVDLDPIKVMYAATTFGIAATFTAFDWGGIWLGAERQIVGDPFGESRNKDRVVAGLNITI